MLTLKLLSGQDLPDDDPTKDFTLIQITDDEVLQFVHIGKSGVYKGDEYSAEVLALIVRRDGAEQAYPLTGNAYVLNSNGKTVASRAAY
jgi:hypothetical protein